MKDDQQTDPAGSVDGLIMFEVALNIGIIPVVRGREVCRRIDVHRNLKTQSLK